MLRDYQTRTLELCKKAIGEGKKRVLVTLPTGAGKTVIFIEQIKEAFQQGKRVLVLCRRRSIIAQTDLRICGALKRYDRPVGTLMGSTNFRAFQADIVVSSIDTVFRRLRRDSYKKWLHSFDLVIVDEAHDATSNSYAETLTHINKSERMPNIIGYTATPYHIGNKGHVYWDSCIMPITASELRDQGYLAPLAIYSPAHINTKMVQIVRGDFHQSKLYECVNQKQIYGNILDTYKKLADGQSALVFCVNKEHSRRVAETFKAAGYNAEHCDCGTQLEERMRVMAFMRKSVLENKPFILCNVNIFSTGIDIPEVQVCIQARPTASKVLYIQQVGRILRPHETKGKALLIDHGGNALRFGTPYDDHQPDLFNREKGTRVNYEKTVGYRCQRCAYYCSAKQDKCPACGYAPEPVIPKETLQDLVRLEEEQVKKYKQQLYFIRQALMRRGASPDHAFYSLHKQHGSKIIRFLPDLDCPRWLRNTIIENERVRGMANARKKQVFRGTVYK